MFKIDGLNISLISGDDGVLVVDMADITLLEGDYAILSIRKISQSGSRGDLLAHAIETADLENNRFLWSFLHADTVEYPDGTYKWQVEFVLADEHRILEPGDFKVAKAVSQE